MQKPLLLLFLVLTILFSCQTNTSETKASTEKVENRGANKENWWDKLPRPEWKKFQQIQTSSQWFEAYQITPTIQAIYEPGQFEEVISYLIIGKDKALLWDTGTGIGEKGTFANQLINPQQALSKSNTLKNLLNLGDLAN